MKLLIFIAKLLGFTEYGAHGTGNGYVISFYHK